MKIFNPFRKPWGEHDEGRLQPMIIVVTEEEREKVIAYLNTISCDDLVDIHASGFIVVTQDVMDSATCIANCKKGFGWYGQDL